MLKSNFVKSWVFLGVTILFAPQLLYAGWIKTYGSGVAYSVRQTSDKGFIAVGENSGGFGDVLLVKTDSLGILVWSRTYGNTAELVTDRGTCVQQTMDGGYVIVGFTGGFGGSDSLLLLKTDENGDTMWTKKYGCLYSSEGNFVEQTSDGGYIITGFVNLFGPAGNNLWLLKLDSAGDTMWTRIFDESNTAGGYCVRETSDSCYIIVGFRKEEQNYRNMWLLKTDSLGDTLWTYTYEDTVNSVGHCVQETEDGGYVVVGNKEEILGFGQIWLLKFGKSGTLQWQRTYTDIGEVFGFTYYVQQTNSGEYIIAGTIRELIPPVPTQVILIKADFLGRMLLLRRLGGEDEDWGYCVQQTSDSGYIIAGRLSVGEDPYNNFGLIKTNALGVLQVNENPNSEASSNWEPLAAMGHEIVLEYSDCPQGFRASVYDASGRKVDEIRSTECSGMIVWGECYGSGVYFIRSTSGVSPVTQRVVLLK